MVYIRDFGVKVPMRGGKAENYSNKLGQGREGKSKAKMAQWQEGIIDSQRDL
mgnify:CR=1 FL=1